MAYYEKKTTPSLDASLGLIFRLNYLWSKVDAVVISGDLKKWNFILDRIFCNLLYKDELKVKQDGKIIIVSLDEDDKKVYNQLNQKVFYAMKLIRGARNADELHEANSKLYQALMLKDVGLRKFMQKLKLYLREADTNPARAMWGS